MDNQAVGRRVWEAVGGQKNVKKFSTLCYAVAIQIKR